MIIDYDILPTIVLYATGFFVIYYLLYKSSIYSILDPLFIYVFTTSFSSVLVIYVLGSDLKYLINFFACHLFFYAGFKFVNLTYKKNIIHHVKMPIFHDMYDLRLTLYILFIVYFIANLVMLYTTGFALLDEDPTSAKVENYMKGFGIILKISWGIGGFISAGLLYFIIIKKSFIEIGMLFFVILFTSLEGSKSSLLRILISFGLLATHRVLNNKENIYKAFKNIVPLGLALLLIVFFAVLAKENSDGEQVIFAFVKRLLYGADSILFFYEPVNEQYFSNFHFWEYPAHLFNQILGFLRLVSVDEAMGNVMVANTLPNSFSGTIVGPNTPYYIEGQVYFGYIGSLFYSSIVGALYAFIRNYFFNTNYYSAFWFILITCICQQAMYLSIEVTLFFTQAFDTCFFVIPVYIVVNLILRGNVRMRLLHEDHN